MYNRRHEGGDGSLRCHGGYAAAKWCGQAKKKQKKETGKDGKDF